MTSSEPLDDRLMKSGQRKLFHADKHTLILLHVKFYYSSISRNVIFGRAKLGGATPPPLIRNPNSKH